MTKVAAFFFDRPHTDATPGPPAQMYGSGPAERPEGNYDEPPQGMAPANEYDVVETELN